MCDLSTLYIERGLEKGFKIGFEIGIMKAKTSIILELAKIGIPAEEIARIARISEKETAEIIKADTL